MEARGNRDQMVGQYVTLCHSAERDFQVIATKFTSNYKAYSAGKNVTRNQAGNHKKSIYLSVEDSLKKLKTSYVSEMAFFADVS
jgi:aryl-alcohol dehydrogenase-like predicted oxidoreductase